MDTVFPVMSTKEKDSLSIRLFGNRFQGDQTLGEYLLEFLLVFSSAKKDDESGKFEFHTMDQINQAQTAGALSYYTVPRNGLKRFIFYDRSKQESRSAIDTLAYKNMLSMLQKKSEDPDWPYILQDLLYGYALIIRKRGWYAQSLMPIAPELLFPETLGIKARKNKPLDTPNIEVETMFEYGQHDFLARGGEMYYLQLLEGIYKNQDDPKILQYKKDIERGISYMLKEKSAGFSTIATHLQNWWLEDQNLNDESIYATKLTRKMSLGYLQPGFDRRAKQSLQELACFLSNEMTNLGDFWNTHLRIQEEPATPHFSKSLRQFKTQKGISNLSALFRRILKPIFSGLINQVTLVDISTVLMLATRSIYLLIWKRFLQI